MMMYQAMGVLALMVLPVSVQAAVEYNQRWTGNQAQSFEQIVEAPAGAYRLDISTEGKAPIQVYNRFNGSKAAPIISLSGKDTGNRGSAEIELRATKPDHAYGYAPLHIKVGKGSGGGAYTLSITPLF